jgi:hypothetical protein
MNRSRVAVRGARAEIVGKMAGHTGRANLRPRGRGPRSARRPEKGCRAASGARAKERPCAPGRLGLGKITGR